MPSPTSTTVPTERVSTPASNSSMADLMIVVMSSDRMAIVSPVWVGSVWGRAPCAWVGLFGRSALRAGGELAAQALEAAAHAAVDELVAQADLHSTEQGRIDPGKKLDGAGGQLSQALAKRADLVR